MIRDRSKGLIGLLILVGVLFFLFLFFAFFTVMNLKKTTEFEADELYNDKSPIAVVAVSGVIMDSKKIIEDLMIAEQDKTVQAIILRIDSPGGAVGPTQEIYEEIVRIDKDVKPIYASFGSIAASGGYYIGAATRRIYSNPGTLTGSIGVIMQFADMSKLYEFVKVQPETIKAGRYKDVGSPFRSMTQEERGLMTDMIRGVHDQFINDIERIRKDRIKGNLRDHAQGQIFSGQDALDRGLVDELTGMWAAGRKIHKELKLSGKFSLRFIKRKKPFSMVEFLQGVEESVTDLNHKVNGLVAPMLMFRLQ